VNYLASLDSLLGVFVPVKPQLAIIEKAPIVVNQATPEHLANFQLGGRQ
jgi:hypothetical protein